MFTEVLIYFCRIVKRSLFGGFLLKTDFSFQAVHKVVSCVTLFGFCR